MLGQKYTVYEKIIQKIKQAKHIALVSHKNPDVDTIGSSTACYQAIQDNFLYKKVDLICVDKIPQKYGFLAHIEKFKQEF